MPDPIGGGKDDRWERSGGDIRATLIICLFPKRLRSPTVWLVLYRHFCSIVTNSAPPHPGLAMPNVVLIPTPFERGFVEPILRAGLDLLGITNTSWHIECCGFGLVAAAARTAQTISVHQPKRLLLVGIAGTLHRSVSIGSAYAFQSVTCHGIGVGDALSPQHLSANDLGWSHSESADGTCKISDTIDLMMPKREIAMEKRTGRLISVTSAAADEREVSLRRIRFPDAVAEDMEGFGVALAASLAALPLSIIRGISNEAGNRQHSTWQVEASLRSASTLALEIIRSEE